MTAPSQNELSTIEEVIADELSNDIIPEIEVFKRSEPKLTSVFVPPLLLPEESRLAVEGRLRSRLKGKLGPLKSSWRSGSFLKPSHVQILVDNEGKVISGVLLKSSGHLPADQSAMEFALSRIVFERTSSDILESGNLVFHWHVDSSSITNIFERSP